MQGPVPISYTPFGLVRKLKRIPIARIGLAGSHSIAKDGFDFFARIQVETVLAHKELERMAACVRISLVHPHKIQIPVQIDDAEMRCRKDAIEQFVVLLQRLLRLDPLRNVAQHHAEQPLPRPFDLRNRGVDREFPAVDPPSDYLAKAPHAAIGDPRARIVPDVCVVRLEVALRNQHGDRRAQQLRFAVAEHSLDRGVDERDFMALVDGDDGVRRRCDDAGQALLGVLALGDVARRRRGGGTGERRRRGRFRAPAAFSLLLTSVFHEAPLLVVCLSSGHGTGVWVFFAH